MVVFFVVYAGLYRYSSNDERIEGGDLPCLLSNFTFGAGEEITYVVYYYLMGAWVPAGEVNFKIGLKQWGGKVCYHFLGTGKTYPFYEWFYTVRDTYEAIADTSTLLPYYFMRKIQEGDFFMIEKTFFDYDKGKIYTITKRLTNPIRVDTFNLEPCIFDVLTGTLWARNIPIDKYSPGDKIYMTLFLDLDTHKIYIKYHGREVKSVKGSVYKTIKISPLLIPGTIFKGGEEMTVWVADDSTRIPLYVESPIVVGSIRGYIKEIKNTRNRFTAKIK